MKSTIFALVSLGLTGVPTVAYSQDVHACYRYQPFEAPAGWPTTLANTNVVPWDVSAICAAGVRGRSRTHDMRHNLRMAMNHVDDQTLAFTRQSFGPEGTRFHRQWMWVNMQGEDCDDCMSEALRLQSLGWTITWADSDDGLRAACGGFVAAAQAFDRCIAQAQPRGSRLCAEAVQQAAGEEERRRQAEERRRQEQERREQLAQQQREQREQQQREQEAAQRRQQEAAQRRQQEQQVAEQRRRSEQQVRLAAEADQRRRAQEEQRRRAEAEAAFSADGQRRLREQSARREAEATQRTQYMQTLGSAAGALAMLGRNDDSHYRGTSWRFDLGLGLVGAFIPAAGTSTSTECRSSACRPPVVTPSDSLVGGGGAALDVAFFPVENPHFGIGFTAEGRVAALLGVAGYVRGGLRLHLGWSAFSLLADGSIGYMFGRSTDHSYDFFPANARSGSVSNTRDYEYGGGDVFFRGLAGVQVCTSQEAGYCDVGFDASAVIDLQGGDPWSNSPSIGAALRVFSLGLGYVQANVFWDHRMLGASESTSSSGFMMDVSVVKQFTFFGSAYSTREEEERNTVAATWSDVVTTQIGGSDTARIYCPSGGTPGAIWGTDFYTSGSSICTAAVHAGLITFSSGGVVILRYGSGRSSYEGTSRNGVTSLSYGRFETSFSFDPQP